MSEGESAKVSRPSTSYANDAPATSIWHSLTNTVLGIDREKIKNTKDDIDTLLVFAGLFSAVLSAFLLQSLDSLQSSPDDEVVFLLRRIATQSYSISSGFLNVTSPLQETQTPFEAPNWALRVNGLWFASLILSLATASLGMLVKSWLREYLSGDWVSPQVKLRARQYRHPALMKWKVFEIAAVLPILLQVALGLFFVGLCFYTGSIHPEMFKTTVPLVMGWAFFFFMTIIAPLLSPRCPYKLFLLKHVLRLGRSYVLPAVLRLGELLYVHPFILPIFSLPNSESIHKTKWTYEEEEDIIFSAQDDMEIFLTVDEMMLDDALLGTMWEALRRSRPDPPTVIKLALQLVRRRVPGLHERNIPDENLTCILDLSELSQQAWLALTTMMGDLIELNKPGILHDGSPVWLGDAIILLLSKSPYSLPTIGYDAIFISFRSDINPLAPGKTLGKRIGFAAARGRQFIPLSTQLAALCRRTQELEIRSLLHIYNALLGTHVETEGALLETLWTRPEIVTNPVVRLIMEDIWRFSRQVVEMQLVHMPYRLGHKYCLLFLVEFAPKLGYTQDALKIFTQYWSSKEQRFRTMSLSTASHPRACPPDAVTYPMYEGALVQASPEERHQIMLQSSAFLKAYLDDEITDESKTYEPLDMVRLCYLFLRLYEKLLDLSPCVHAHGQQSLPETKPKQSLCVCSPIWTEFWTKMGLCLDKYFKAEGWKKMGITCYWHNPTLPESTTEEERLDANRTLAAKCLRMVGRLSGAEGDPVQTHLKLSSLPSDIVSSLGHFTKSEDISLFPILVRARAAQAELTPRVTGSGFYTLR